MCLLDRQRKVTVMSREYARLSGSNDGALPPLGKAWKHLPKSVKLTDGDDGTREFTVEDLSLPQDGHDLVLLSPVSRSKK